MKKHTKIVLWFMLTGLWHTEPCLTQPNQNIYIREEYIPAACIALAVSMYTCTYCTTPKDLSTQQVINCLDSKIFFNDLARYKQELANIQKVINLMDIYYPSKKSDLPDKQLQKLALQAQCPVIRIHEKNLRDNPNYIDIFFDQAKLLEKCIIYIEKDIEVEDLTPLSYRLFNYNKTTPKDSLHTFIQNIKTLEETYDSIIVLGSSKNKISTTAIDDINTIGFNIEHENPSYYERLEFFKLIFTIKNYDYTAIEKIAKKTIGFTYLHLMHLIEQAQQLAIKDKSYSIEDSHLNKAYAITKSSYEIYSIEEKDLYQNAIHEIGHAIIAAHFKAHYKVCSASITPQCSFYRVYSESHKQLSLGRVSYIKKEHYECDAISIKKENIIIALAGKVAEQLFFGLLHNKVLTHKNCFNNLIENPNGAENDLQKARSIAQDIIKKQNNNNNSNPDDLVFELYETALQLVISYKDFIAKLARSLEEREYLNGSDIYAHMQQN